MPTGSTITYTVTGTIAGNASGNLDNTAQVNPPAGVVDSDPTNNESTVTDDLVAEFDVSVTKVSDQETVSNWRRRHLYHHNRK